MKYLPWLVMVWFACAGAVHAQQMQQVRHASRVGGKLLVSGGLAVQDLSEVGPADLFWSLAPQGLMVQNLAVRGAPVAAGVFQGGSGILGLEDGLVLSTGCVKNVIGPNILDDIACDNGMPGDPDLQAQVPLFPTLDASFLEFDVVGGPATAIAFEYVFASDEYNEFVGGAFNDVFGIFVNGVNIATVPGSPSTPVSIASVNCGQPYAPPAGGTNCALYINNDLSDGGGSVNTEMDGLTVLLTATAPLLPGMNHVKIAIADSGDRLVDSNVFVRMKGPAFGGATPCGQTLSVNVGKNVSFPVAASSSTGGIAASVQLTASGLPSAAVQSPALPTSGQPASSTLSWTPTDADVGQHTIVYTAVDEAGVGSDCTVTIDVQCTGSATEYGSATPGTGGNAPLLSVACASPGALMAIHVSGGFPGAHGCLLLGTATSSTIMAGAQVLVESTAAFAHDLDGAGAYSLTLSVPADPTLVGTFLYLQAGYLDPGASGGISATRGLRVTFGS